MREKKALLVYNPSSGKKKNHKSLPEIKKKLMELGFQLTIYQTTLIGQSENLIQKACQNRWEAIFIAGGDGTINHVIQHLAEEEYRPRIGIFPFGTSNEFAKHIGVPCNVNGALSIIQNGFTKTVDIGRFGDNYFANIAAAGWLTDITYKASPFLKSRIGEWAYGLSFVKTFFVPGLKNTISITISNEDVISDLAFFLIMNGGSVGPFESLFDDSGYNDGFFHLITCKKTNRLHLLFSILTMKFKIKSRFSVIEHHKIKSCDFSLPKTSLINLDGEQAQANKMSFQILPKHLYVFSSTNK